MKRSEEQLENARRLYKRIRADRSYLPKWRDLTDRQISIIIGTVDRTRQLESQLSGAIYHLTRTA